MADEVEVVYALRERQVVVAVEHRDGLTVEQAIRLSGILDTFSEIDLSVNRVGVFGKLAKLDRPVAPGDRVEIYRPLLADPKEIRRKLAAEGKTMGKNA